MNFLFFLLFLDHDDRSNDGRKKERNTTRRVSFKPSALQSKGGIKGRVNELALRSRLEDDEDMDGLVTNLNVGKDFVFIV